MKRMLLGFLVVLFLCGTAWGQRITVTKDSAGTISGVTAYVTASGVTLWEATATGVSTYSISFMVPRLTAYTGVSAFTGATGFSFAIDTHTGPVQSTSNDITGSVYYCDLTSSETLSGKTLYGGWVGNWGATAGVTATVPEAAKGMSVVFENTQGQESGKTIYVVFNALDNIIGLTSGFVSGDSTAVLSGDTLAAKMVLTARDTNYWFVSSVTGITYRNR